MEEDDGAIVKDDEELSEEDKALKEGLELAVARLKETQPGAELLYMQAMTHLTTEIQQATSSMTAVPRPLKFLRPYFDDLRRVYDRLMLPDNNKLEAALAAAEGETDLQALRTCMADILSVLAMVMAEPGSRQSLAYKLKGTLTGLVAWGHEYMRSLCGEIAAEYADRMIGKTPTQPLPAPPEPATALEQAAATAGAALAQLAKAEADSSSSSSNSSSSSSSDAPSASAAAGGDSSGDSVPTATAAATATAMVVEATGVDEAGSGILVEAEAVVAGAAAGAGEPQPVDDLMVLVNDIVPFNMHHNAEAEAVDLLMEVQQLPILLEDGLVDKRNFGRVCLYLVRCADFQADPDDYEEVLHTAFELYRRHGSPVDAVRVALRMDDADRIREVLTETESDSAKKQIAFVLGQHRSAYVAEDDEELEDIIGNNKLSEHFLGTARALDLLDPKTPEDIYKTHLADAGGFNLRRRNAEANTQVDSARANLAASYVSAFVNAGFGKDTLMTDETSGWLHRNKTHGQTAAVASLGMVLMWDVEEGLTNLDKYLYHDDENVKAGACLAIGVTTAGVRNESDPALALLTEQIESPHRRVRLCSILGLGIAYAGQQREDCTELLVPIVQNTDADAHMGEVCFAALALGMIFCGSCDEEVGSELVQRFMEASEAELNQSVSRFLCLGLGLLFLGKQERCEGMVEAVKTVEHARAQYAAITLETCAYAGTGNVLKVQQMLHVCAEHETDEDKAQHQMVAVLGIACVALGEDIGSEMCLRTFDHLLHYAELPVKRVVPLALALLYVSQPDYSVVDQLSRLSHHEDAKVSQAAILGMGLVAAGTNNSRVAGLLRALSDFYSKEANHLFVVRIAQGLTALGKGLTTLSPVHSDRFLMRKGATAGLLTVLHACLDMEHTILDEEHFLLYALATAICPRFMVTVNEELEWTPATVRVGQAVETVGLAGRPRGITGFQTHTSPVLLASNERSEIATSEYRAAAATVLEGAIILEKKPDAEESDSPQTAENKESS